MSIWDSLLGIAGSIGTGLINSRSTGKAAWLSYLYNTELQKQQQRYSTKMANTAHQREVKDLRKAGLNPILSATGGSGAAVPTSGAGGVSVSPAEYENPISSALAIRQQKNANKLTESQNKLTEEQTKKTSSDIGVNDSIVENYKNQDAKIKNDIINNTAVTAKQISKIDKEIGMLDEQIKTERENRKYIGFNAQTSRIGANASAVGANASMSQAGTARSTYLMNKSIHDSEIQFKRKHPKISEFGTGFRMFTNGFSIPTKIGK